jgi:hypothetical protein
MAVVVSNLLRLWLIRKLLAQDMRRIITGETCGLRKAADQGAWGEIELADAVWARSAAGCPSPDLAGAALSATRPSKKSVAGFSP